MEDLEQSVPSHSIEGLVGRKSLLISDVLVFVTGCENIPPLGFSPKPTIVFDHDCGQRKISVNTSINRLTFPVSDVLLQYENFKEDIIFCILNSQGFGMI